MSHFLNNLNSKGFIFHKYNLSDFDFTDEYKLVHQFIDYIKTIINIKNEELYYDIDIINLNERHLPHYHIIPGSFQVVIWLPDVEFEGRHFLFGTPNNLNQTKPKLGYMCFLKPNDPNFIHGTTSLLSDVCIKSIGISSLIKDISGNRDIFVESFDVKNELINIESLY